MATPVFQAERTRVCHVDGTNARGRALPSCSHYNQRFQVCPDGCYWLTGSCLEARGFRADARCHGMGGDVLH